MLETAAMNNTSAIIHINQSPQNPTMAMQYDSMDYYIDEDFATLLGGALPTTWPAVTPPPLLSHEPPTMQITDYNDEDLAAVLGEAFPNSWPESFSAATLSTERPLLSHEPPAKQRRTNNNFGNLSAFERASSSFVLNFGHVSGSPHENYPPVRNQGSNVKETPIGVQTGHKPGRVRPHLQAYDHITAERKRREQLSQLFITLSGIIPGLKKMDKNSVLGDAITYLKQLKERVKMLEEKTAKQTIESVVFVNKSQTILGENVNEEEQALPEIDAKVSERTILLNILCEKRKGNLVKLLGEVEKLNLVVVNTSVASFGIQAFHITIMAEMEQEFTLSVKDVVAAIHCALQTTA